MQGLTKAEVESLMSKPDEASKPKGKPKGMLYMSDGTAKELYGNVSEQVGTFDSKLGTAVRSRKGRTYRKGNGYARYKHPEPWNATPVEPVVSSYRIYPK